MRTLRYVLVDVFTDRALTGNALAVFTDARGLDASTMQAIAREMNLSETVFIQSPTEGGHARLRIFTPAREVPFAGHPTLGAAFVLGGPMQADALNLETGRGIVSLRLDREAAKIVFARMLQPLPAVRDFGPTEALFAALGVRGSSLPVALYDNGITHCQVVLDDRAAVAAVRPDLRALAGVSALCVSVCAGEGTRWKTRVFAPGGGVDEDPATGSAAGPLALHLATHGRAPWGEELEIDQGEELSRPSRLVARVERGPEGVTAVEVGGAAVIVGRGELRV